MYMYKLSVGEYFALSFSNTDFVEMDESQVIFPLQVKQQAWSALQA